MRLQELSKEIKQRKSIEFELNTANRALEKLATTDVLTDVHNRRSIEKLGKALEAESLRYLVHYSVFMLDVDHFKQVNDRWGHKTGDLVLRQIALKIRSQLREGDNIGRWGGEEFIILTKQISHDASVEFANRLCQTISKLEYDSIGHITISIGVASNHTKEKFDGVLLRADQALYLAKQRGRNRVEAIV
ncbi:MAG: GGDEF domain-containing protein [Gammaproteobacteria bacterium]|nr:GGDEF domain-containing protein [Gammaproteobacteria bacterium]